MKKFNYISFIIFLITGELCAQYTGSGTIEDPFVGTITTNTTWYGLYPGNTVYVSSSAQSLTVQTGYYLTVSSGLTLSINGEFIINPGAAVTAGTIINNGFLKLQSDESGIASLIHSGYTGSGTTQTELYLTGGFITIEGIDYYKWHYISTPVNNVPVDIFTGPGYTLDIAQYVESLVGEDPVTGWVAFDGYVYEPEGQNNNFRFSSLTLGKGYNYYHTSNETYILNGSLNINSINVTLDYGGLYSDSQGFNLIGNPFSSCFNWDYLFENNLIPSNIYDAIYFTNNGGYGSYVNGVGQGGGGPIIPPMQGFFVKAIEDDALLYLPNEARIHDLNQPRYKGKNDKETIYRKASQFVRLKIESQKDSDDLVVRFDDLATIDFDKSFDAYKLNRIGSPVSLWSKAGEIDYSINGLPFPEVSVEIPIGLFAASKGKYKISAAEVIGLEKYNLSIVDLETHITREIKEDDGFEFSLAGGVVENRFILKLTDKTKIDPAILNKKFNIYSAFGTLNITSLTDEFDKEKGIVSVYDLTGKKINQQSEVDWGAKYDQKQIPIKAKTSGIYIIEIKIRNRKYIEKVNIIF